MTRVVLDANVLAPAFANPAAAAGGLIARWRKGAFELVVSVPILTGLRRTFQDPYLRPPRDPRASRGRLGAPSGQGPRRPPDRVRRRRRHPS
ncbi:MAG: PIN domain-containing protein [Chloroflexia bacterium]|nr:PIN domain-containing protein [Chloroflexia bacterium]